ncbi:MAG: hypothetical protein Q7I95_06970 [Thiobacillus sp.]|nr:hypothetical protein [Thiobacillus sp.]
MITHGRMVLSLPGGIAALAVTLAGNVPVLADAADISLSEADKLAVFKAAGAAQRKGVWVICADDPNPTGALIETVRDLNGDGRPEAVVSEGGTFCYGHTGLGYRLLSKQADGTWRVMSGGIGIPEFLQSKGVGGWPDISVGGPGFCFPVQRWNGKVYALNRFEYEGKRCKPPR